MDDRQQQIQTGAGLTESRLNTEFIDFLRKYLPWMLTAILVAVGVYMGLNYLKEKREKGTDMAFRDYEAARAAGNPNNLVRVADDHSDRPGVALLARLAAGDELLSSVAKGLVPGATSTNGQFRPEDVLTAEARTDLLTRAQAQFEAALSLASSSKDYAQHEVAALFGLAAVAENQGKADAAKGYFERAATAAEGAGLAGIAAEAKGRIASLGQLSSSAKLLSEADLRAGRYPYPFPPTPLVPEEPVAPAPAPAATAPATTEAPATPPATAPTGAPAPTPASTPVPAPTPAPAGKP